MNQRHEKAVVKKLESGMLNIELSKVANAGPASHADPGLISIRSKISHDRKATAASTALNVVNYGDTSNASTKRALGHLESGSDRFTDQITE